MVGAGDRMSARCLAIALTAALPGVANLVTTAAALAASPTHCDVAVPAGGTALADAVASAKAGTRLCLAAGTHAGGFAIDKSLTLLGIAGSDATTITGTPKTAVLRIDDDGLAVRLEGLTLSGGSNDAGGGLAINGRGKVDVTACRFTGNTAGMVGGGGLYARAGLLNVSGCQFEGNSGRQGGAIMLDQALKATFTRCTLRDNRGELGGALRVSEGVQVAFKATEIRKNVGQDGSCVRVSGTTSRKPNVVFDHCTIGDGQLINGPDITGYVAAKSSTLPASWKAVHSLQLLGNNTLK